MPQSAFPLSRSKSRFYRLGAYRWRVVRFTAVDRDFRLLIAYHADKEQYRAVLASDRGRDLAVIAQYEFHGTHPGWHVLASCDDLPEVPVGIMRHPWQVRFPKPRGFHRGSAFGISNEGHALERAAKFFRLHKAEGTIL